MLKISSFQSKQNSTQENLTQIVPPRGGPGLSRLPLPVSCHHSPNVQSESLISILPGRSKSADLSALHHGGGVLSLRDKLCNPCRWLL